MSADRLLLLVERHSLLLFVRQNRRQADAARLDAQHIDEETATMRNRISEIERYLAEQESAP